MRFVLATATVVMLAAAFPRLQAQTSHAAPASALDAAVQEHVNMTVDDREAVLRVLRRSEVKALVSQAGVDLRRAEAAVSTLRGADLARVAAHARQLEESLAGGQTKAQYAWYFFGLALLPLIAVLFVVLT